MYLYKNFLLFGLPQLIGLHAARRRDHIIPLLQDLHWLRVADRISITFQLAVL